MSINPPGASVIRCHKSNFLSVQLDRGKMPLSDWGELDELSTGHQGIESHISNSSLEQRINRPP